MPEVPSHALLVTGARTWDARDMVREAFRSVWQDWGPASVTRPLLLSGHAATGADAIAEQLFAAEGFPTATFPADWHQHGRRAGFLRNKVMVDEMVRLHRAGTVVAVVAFLDRCRMARCPQRRDLQLMPQGQPMHYVHGRLTAGGTLEHYSHGTAMCRAIAIDAQLPVHDVFHPQLPPI